MTPTPRALSALAVTVLTAGFLAAGLPGVALADTVAPAADVFPQVGTADYDVEHYDVQMDYRASDDVSVVTTITASAAVTLDTIRLDFEGLIVDAVSVNGTAAAFTREDDDAATLHKLVVAPAAPVSGDFTVEVSYHGAPGTHQDPDGSFEGWMPTTGGVVALGQPVGTMTWLPSNNTPSDKATYDIEVTAPTQTNARDLSVASSGNLVGREGVGADRTRWSWSVGVPLSTSMLVLAVGPYDVFGSTITLASGRVLPELSFVTVDASDEDKALVADMRGRITSMLNWLETKLGPYPGESTGLIYDYADVGYALETQDRPFFDGWIDDTTLLHELTHMWLGNSVSPRTWSEIWLSEGGASFFESYYAWEVHSQTDPRELATEAIGPDGDPDIWQVPTVGWTDPAQVFGSQSYTRGSYVYSALMNAIGPDGFDAVLRAWTAKHATSSVVTQDFLTLANEVSGRDLSRTLVQWISSDPPPAVPAVIQSFEPLTAKTTAGTSPELPAEVTPVYASESGVPASGVPVPVTWDSAGADWSTPGTVTLTGSGTDFFGAPFTTASIVVTVVPGPTPTQTGSPTPTASPTASPSPTVSPSASTPGVAQPPGTALSATGSTPAYGALFAGGMLLAIGAAVLVIARRRRRAN